MNTTKFIYKSYHFLLPNNIPNNSSGINVYKNFITPKINDKSLGIITIAMEKSTIYHFFIIITLFIAE